MAEADIKKFFTKPEVDKFDFEKFKKYVESYKPGELSAKTVMLDMLYGLGKSVDEKEFRFAEGFFKFKVFLRRFVTDSKRIKPNENEKTGN